MPEISQDRKLGCFCIWAANHFVKVQMDQIELQESNVCGGASHG